MSSVNASIIEEPLMLWIHLPSESPRTALHASSATSTASSEYTKVWLSGRRAAEGPTMYENSLGI